MQLRERPRLCVILRNLSFIPKAVLENFNQKCKMIRLVSQKQTCVSEAFLGICVRDEPEGVGR